MVSSLSAAMGIATKSMQVNQSVLGVVANNVANVNTEGYTRQIARTVSATLGGFSSGVDIGAIERNVDNLLETRIVGQTADVGYSQQVSDVLRSVETVFGTSSNTLDTMFNQFFDDLNTLSNYTDSTAQRVNVMQSAEFLVDNVRGISNELTNITLEVDQEIDRSITKINTILKHINDLNLEISSIKLSGVSGTNTSALEDQRQMDLQELATFLKIESSIDQYGMMRVVTEDGRRLADPTGYTRLERTTGTPYQGVGIRPVLASGGFGNAAIEMNTSQMTSGSIKALIDMRDTELPKFTAQLNEMANTLITEFNTIHSQGTAIPPQNSLTSGNGSVLTATTSDMYTEMSAGLASSSMHISVINTVTNAVVATTVNNGGAFTMPAAGPYSLDNLATDLGLNADVGAALTVTTGNDANGTPFIKIAATNANYSVVLSSVTGDPLGKLGMNNFFTGTNAADIAIRSDIKASPALIATARMRTTDGGVSKLDNTNVLEMAKMTDTKFDFDAAGGLSPQNASFASYAISINSSLAITLRDAGDSLSFDQTFLNDMKERQSSFSGVNIDEELASLIVYQNAFQASAKVISMIDEMLDALSKIM